MADSTSVLATLLLTTLQSAKEAAANNLFNAASPADLYANNPATTTGLTWGYIGGRVTGTAVANGTVALTNNATNYIVGLRSNGVVSVSTSTTNWNDETNYIRTYIVTTVSSLITAYDDYRQAIGNLANAVTAMSEEQIQDIIASLITAGSGITLQYNDGDSPATFVISAPSSGGGSMTQEQLEDYVASLITAGAGITKQYNDGDSPATLVLSAASGAKVIQLAVSDETTALTTGTAKITFRMPYAMTLSAGSAGVRASLSTAQATSGGGGIVTVDINEAGSTILSTKLTIDNTEKTSTTAATAAVISDVSLADDAEITIDIDVIGDGTAMGLKVSLIGT